MKTLITQVVTVLRKNCISSDKMLDMRIQLLCTICIFSSLTFCQSCNATEVFAFCLEGTLKLVVMDANLLSAVSGLPIR